MIRYVAEINDERITKVTHSVIQRNAYSLHSENMLCAMLTDPRPNVRMLAVNKIIQIRGRISHGLRKFVKPKVLFSADDYYLLIGDDNFLESRLTQHIEIEYLLSLTTETVEIFEFPRYPSHSQSVERHIRLVSETCTMIASQEERDSRISITLAEREIMPCFR